MSIDELVYILDYDPSWPLAFAAEQRRLCEALSMPETDVEHIGSTAVPGLEAKPVIDLMLGALAFPPSEALTSRLQVIGYEALGEAGVPERLYFRRRAPDAFNLHVVRRNGDHWISNLALRDYLRAHPSEQRHYAQAKREAIALGRNTLISYSEGKAAIVSELTHRARKWRNAA